MARKTKEVPGEAIGAQPWASIRPPKEPVGVIRDYIPAGEPLSPAEKARVDSHRRLGDYDFVQKDYIPDPRDPSTKGEPQLASLTFQERLERQDRMRKQAEEAALAHASQGREQVMAQAKKRLRTLNVADTIDLISNATQRAKQVFLQAELETQARNDVLKHFKVSVPDDEPVDPAPSETD